MKHIPRKRFGQNFLTDQQVINDIIRVIAPAPDDTMVEIGPGQGAMTALLLPHLSQLHVVEIDRDLVAMLQKKFSADKLIMHAGDALQFDFSTLQPAQGKLRIAGNLPYNISSPLLFHLAQYAPLVEDQHFMLQKEVVQRMVAPPGG
jgi:16S rRNA (adenine1518-N6/adenine1519-N6)-dimethyltransferase